MNVWKFKSIADVDSRIIDIEIILDSIPEQRQALVNQRRHAGDVVRQQHFDREIMTLDAATKELTEELQELRTKRPDIKASLEELRKKRQAREFFAAVGGGQKVLSNIPPGKTKEERRAEIARINEEKKRRSLAQLGGFGNLIETFGHQ